MHEIYIRSFFVFLRFPGFLGSEPRIFHVFLFIFKIIFLKVAQAGEQTRDLLISFIFSFRHFTAEPQRLPILSFISSLLSG
jgi:hypothetical protein